MVVSRRRSVPRALFKARPRGHDDAPRPVRSTHAGLSTVAKAVATPWAQGRTTSPACDLRISPNQRPIRSIDVSVKSFENGTITLPAYCGKPSMPDRKGTEPGTVDAEHGP